MEKWVPLIDLLSDKKRYESITQLFINYHPDSGAIELPENRTGWKNDQFAKTENELGWHPMMACKSNISSGYFCKATGKRFLYLISHNVTIFKLGLGHRQGYTDGPDIIEECSEKLYSCQQLEATGKAMTKAIFEELPNSLKEFQTKNRYCRYWLATQRAEIEDVPGLSYYNLCYAFGKYMDTGLMHDTYRRDYQTQRSLRPIVQLSENILVNIGDSHFNGTAANQGFRLKLP